MSDEVPGAEQPQDDTPDASAGGLMEIVAYRDSEERAARRNGGKLTLFHPADRYPRHRQLYNNDGWHPDNDTPPAA